MSDGRLVCIATPKQGNRIPDDALVCLDNGCFGKGYPGDDGWMAWLESQRHLAPRALFAVAPDVVGDARATYERSLPFLPFIRSLGFPAAYVIQDGQEDFEPPWDEFDVVFIGGSTEWKLGPRAAAIAREANRRDKWVHMGRVNSRRRWSYAEHIGCDSVDGTYIAFGPDINLPAVLSWAGQTGIDFGSVA
jgi:hypothetical protein